jgi:hypothetical protein
VAKVSASVKYLPLFPEKWNITFWAALALKQVEVAQMDEGTELATVGLVATFAAVLLVLSHFFIQGQSAKHLVKDSIGLKATTNVVAGWL